MTIALARFIVRRHWSMPEGSCGPLIAVYHDEKGFGYVALRLRIWHKFVWIRLVKRERNRFSRLYVTRILDERGHKCECGSGRWIQNDMDGCGCVVFLTAPAR